MAQKIFFSVLLVCFAGLMIAGCEEKTLKQQRENCVKVGKKFTVETKLNFRTGENEHKGKCK